MSASPLTVELLYLDGCPNHAPTVALLGTVLQDLGVDARVSEIEVRDPGEADRMGFRGSPTVRVNGRDIEPGPPGPGRGVFGCRLYGRSGTPPREWIERALRAGRGALDPEEEGSK